MAASMGKNTLLIRRTLDLFCQRNVVLFNRLMHTSITCLGAHDSEYNAAKERLNTLKEDPGNQAKLQIYALFKQASLGKCSTKRPGMVDFVGRAKWDAWNSLGDISQDEAQLKYIGLVNELAGSDTANEETQTSTEGYKTIKVENRDNMFIITLNRPDKYNAISLDMYEDWTNALEEGANNKSTITVVTGAGKYYCSGNDLSNFDNIPAGGIAEMAKKGGEIMRRFVGAFIDHPKPLIGIVNGPAVGISVTTLGLFDLVYAADHATFNTPFSALGQSPEGCSSYVFPRIMGQAKANEMLLFNRKLTAHEACNRGLVSEVFPQHVFQEEAWKKVQEFAKLPRNSLSESKKLIREHEKEALHRANRLEAEVLLERWQSDECMNAIMNFFQRKS